MPKLSLEVRFWSKVDRRGPDDCWEWQAARNPSTGYGQFAPSTERHETAHRVAYTLAHGVIPEGLVVRHTCDNRPCVNPAHLLVGTPADNQRDMAERGRSFSAWGERSGKAKLTWRQVDEIRRLYAQSGTTHRELGRRFGVAHQTIGLILRNRAWREDVGARDVVGR